VLDDDDRTKKVVFSYFAGAQGS